MPTSAAKAKAGGWQRVLAWCAGAALCLWLVSTVFTPGRPAVTAGPAGQQEVRDADASTGAAAPLLLAETGRPATDAAHEAILQRFLQLYGSAPPRASEIAVATAPQQSPQSDGDDQSDGRAENSDDSQPLAPSGGADPPVATPFRQTDQERLVERNPSDVQAPEANGLNADFDTNAAAAILGEEQEIVPSRALPELPDQGQNNYTAVDSEARQESTGDTKPVVNIVQSGVKYDSSARWWPSQPDNRVQQLPDNMEPMQSFSQDTPSAYPQQSNGASSGVESRWRDSAAVEAYAHSPPQHQRLQERTVQVQPLSRQVYIPEAMMWRNPQGLSPFFLTGSKSWEALPQAKEEMQQPVLYETKSSQQLNQNADYQNSPAISRNIIYPNKWGTYSYEGTGMNNQRYNTQGTPDIGVARQKLFGRKYLSVPETSREDVEAHEENNGIVRKSAAENKDMSQNTAQNVLSNKEGNDQQVNYRNLITEDARKDNSYEVNSDKQGVGEGVGETSNLRNPDKAEEKVLKENTNVVDERQSAAEGQGKSKSLVEDVKLQETSVQNKEEAKVTKSKKESVSVKKAGVVKEKTEGVKGKLKCPDGELLSVQDGGRLGNKLWEYAAVWALPRALPGLNKTAVVPRSLLRALSKLFHNLTLPALEDLPEDCPARRRLEASEPVKRWRLEPATRALSEFQGRPLLLHRWIVLAEPVVARLQELRETDFRLRPELAAAAQQQLWALRRRSGLPDRAPATFVGVHVRRTDFSSWLPRVYNRSLADASFFSAGMALCRARARLWRGGRALFAVASDDPDWCEKHLADGGGSGSKDVLVARGGSPEQDLALLAACNQSLLDYGTFGQWAALLAGGPAVSLRLDPHVDQHLAALPGWTLA